MTSGVDLRVSRFAMKENTSAVPSKRYILGPVLESNNWQDEICFVTSSSKIAGVFGLQIMFYLTFAGKDSFIGLETRYENVIKKANLVKTNAKYTYHRLCS